jgi:glycosyltransferase involved in cell wall biosynthesis
VGALVSDLREACPDFGRSPGIIVVDDGSTDATARVARAAGALVLRHHGNRGKGAALRTGLEQALALGAGAAVAVDADGQHPADEAAALAGHPAPPAALVLGVRDLVGAGAPRANRISNSISDFFLSMFTGRRLADTQCGLRRYPLPATLELGARADGYAFEAEVVLRAARAGWSIEQVPVRVVYAPSAQRVSHFHVVRDPARIVARVVATMLTTSRSD